MDFLADFLGQVFVLVLMIGGMFAGEAAGSYILGEIIGRAKRFIYLFFFICFLALGSQLPQLFSLRLVSLMDSVFLFTAWGFVTVFTSRVLLFVLDELFFFLGSLKGSKMEHPRVDASGIESFLLQKGLGPGRVSFVLEAGVGRDALKDGRKGKKTIVSVNPCRLSAAAHRGGLSAPDVVELLVFVFGFSPEKAASIWGASAFRL